MNVFSCIELETVVIVLLLLIFDVFFGLFDIFDDIALFAIEVNHQMQAAASRIEMEDESAEFLWIVQFVEKKKKCWS